MDKKTLFFHPNAHCFSSNSLLGRLVNLSTVAESIGNTGGNTTKYKTVLSSTARYFINYKRLANNLPVPFQMYGYRREELSSSLLEVIQINIIWLNLLPRISQSNVW